MTRRPSCKQTIPSEKENLEGWWILNLFLFLKVQDIHAWLKPKYKMQKLLKKRNQGSLFCETFNTFAPVNTPASCRLNLYNIQTNRYFLLGFWCKWERCKARLGFDSDFTDIRHLMRIGQCTLMISQSVCLLIWMYPNYITLIVLKFLGKNVSAPPETKSR